MSERDKERAKRLKEIADSLGEDGTPTSLGDLRKALREALEELAK